VNSITLKRGFFIVDNLFHGYRLRQVARLVNVSAFEHGDVVRQQLQWVVVMLVSNFNANDHLGCVVRAAVQIRKLREIIVFFRRDLSTLGFRAVAAVQSTGAGQRNPYVRYLNRSDDGCCDGNS
jgi:hypothetical protein